MSQPGGKHADDLTDVLRRQHTVVSREQALACGLSPAAVRHRIRPGGPWQTLLPGVYAASTGAVTADQRDMAALLHAGPRSVITGPAALRRAALTVPSDGIVDVLLPAGMRRVSSAFVRIQQTTRMPDQVCVTGEIRFTVVPRAVGDAVRSLRDLAEVRAVVAGAIQRRRCTIASLARELAAGPAGGSALFAAALAEVADGIRSVAEGDFLDLLKRARLPIPMLNARLLQGERFLAMVDCYWPPAGVAAEVDSREWHFTPAEWQQTMARHTRLTSLGLSVLHFTPQQIRGDSATVVARVRSALAASAGPPASVRALPATA